MRTEETTSSLPENPEALYSSSVEGVIASCNQRINLLVRRATWYKQLPHSASKREAANFQREALNSLTYITPFQAGAIIFPFSRECP